jgi:hypothetical protein
MGNLISLFSFHRNRNTVTKEFIIMKLQHEFKYCSGKNPTISFISDIVADTFRNMPCNSLECRGCGWQCNRSEILESICADDNPLDNLFFTHYLFMHVVCARMHRAGVDQRIKYELNTDMEISSIPSPQPTHITLDDDNLVNDYAKI